MKNLIPLILVVFFSTPALELFSQPCLPGYTVFWTQEDIDNFQANYPDCTEIEGIVNISGRNITNLNGLSMLTSVGGLEIDLCDSLKSLEGLENLTSITNGLFIYVNPLLQDLSGLDNLSSIGDWFVVKGGYLTSLEGLGNLVSIGGYMQIEGNTSLKNCEGLNKLETIHGDFEIRNADSLVNFSGLNNLVSIGGTMNIDYNKVLQDFTGLESLNIIGYRLKIGRMGFYPDGNPSLTSLKGLENLVSAGKSLIIGGNEQLTDISALANISADSLWQIMITQNELLSDCAIKSLCKFLEISTVWNDIQGNAPGCNSREEVEEACESISVEEIESVGCEINLSCSPNPVSSDKAKIQFTLPESNFVNLEIYDKLGQKTAGLYSGYLPKGDHTFSWNAESVSEGMYLLRLEVNGSSNSMKLLLLK